jgi:hypothetical protein
MTNVTRIKPENEQRTIHRVLIESLVDKPARVNIHLRKPRQPLNTPVLVYDVYTQEQRTQFLEQPLIIKPGYEISLRVVVKRSAKIDPRLHEGVLMITITPRKRR